MRRICQVGLGVWVFVVGCTSHQPVVKHTGLLEGVTIQVPALIGGKIVQMQAEEGIEVSAGDTLAQIDDTEWVLQMQELQASIDELAVQEQLAQTAVRRAQVDMDYFQEKYDRIKTLQEREATAQQQVDDLKNRVQQSRLLLLTAQQQVQGLLAKQRQLQARREIIFKKIRDATVIASEGGMVQTRYFEPGEAVPALQAIVELIQVRELDVKVYIPENMLSQIKVGQEVQVHADGLDRAFNGHVRWVSNLAEFTPKTVLTPETRASLVYAVTIGISNPDRILKHGMPVEVIF